jgi:hypothetical protein
VKRSEYHLHDEADSIGYNDISRDFTGEGAFKAWFPQGVTMTETQVCRAVSPFSFFAAHRRRDRATWTSSPTNLASKRTLRSTMHAIPQTLQDVHWMMNMHAQVFIVMEYTISS